MEIWSNLNLGLAIFISRSWDLRPAAGLSSIGHLGKVAVAPKISNGVCPVFPFIEQLFFWYSYIDQLYLLYLYHMYHMYCLYLFSSDSPTTHLSPSRGAVCRIQGSVSSAELNGKRCTVCRHLRSHESHALVEVEANAMSVCRLGISFFLGVHDLVMLFWWSVCWAFRRALVAPGVLVHVRKAKEGGPLFFLIFQLLIYAWVEIGENLLENPFLVYSWFEVKWSFITGTTW